MSLKEYHLACEKAEIVWNLRISTLIADNSRRLN
jgi:hypothetical protein